MHKVNCFLTLTYDNVHLPEGDTLVLRDWQTFAKRLRKFAPFRFFHCGEYGEETLRPHIHALIFGQDFRTGSTPAGKSQSGEEQYTSPIIDEKWGLGRHTLGTLTWQSAGYVARYAMKKINGPPAAMHYQNIDPITGECFQVKPEYATRSMRPGLGYDWIMKYMKQTYPRDYIIINGQQCKPPKYYDKQCETFFPEIWKKVQIQRTKSALKNKAENTPDRLAVREKVLLAKTRTLKRGL